VSSQQNRKPDQPDEARHRQEGATRKARIVERIVKALGHSSRFRIVQVKPLWAYNYRVNVLIGADALSAKIAHSYFVETDLEGNIVESTPRISVAAASA
jgi:hypothetical protein